MSLELTENLDLLPEYCRYRDDGCESATTFLGRRSSCLNCPFDKCVFEEPRGRQRYRKGLRDREVVRLFKNEGKGAKELALRFGVSQRTAQRILKRANNE